MRMPLWMCVRWSNVHWVDDTHSCISARDRLALSVAMVTKNALITHTHKLAIDGTGKAQTFARCVYALQHTLLLRRRWMSTTDRTPLFGIVDVRYRSGMSCWHRIIQIYMYTYNTKLLLCSFMRHATSSITFMDEPPVFIICARLLSMRMKQITVAPFHVTYNTDIIR